MQMKSKLWQRETSKKRIKMLCAIIVVLTLCTALTVTAKYYAAKNNKGIAVASGLYFNSNYLTKISGGIASMNMTEEMIKEIPVTINSKMWTSNTYTFYVEIRNFDNNLLYNDANLNLEYTIAFKLLDAPQGATYKVSYVSSVESAAKLLSAENEIKFTGHEIKGGQALADKYKIEIAMDGGEYSASRILIMAFPTAPDYVKNSAQEMRLLGILKSEHTSSELKIEEQGFIAANKYAAGNEDAWRKVIDELSGFVYNIKTIGDVISQDANAVKGKLKIKWNSKMLTINQFDHYYINADTEKGTETDEDGITWNYMLVKVLPYSNIQATFYQTDAFRASMNAGDGTKMTSKEFEGLVFAEIVED